jgi:hypothetical protein
MGPAIIVDKSVYQGFSPKLVNRLNSLFYPIFTTVLFRECAGNLGKYAEIDECITGFMKTAKAFQSGQGRFMIDVHRLLDLEETGEGFPLDGRPIVIPESTMQTGNGVSVLIEEEEERSQIRGWIKGTFREGERIFWGESRNKNQSYPLEEEFILLKDQLCIFKNMDDASRYVEKTLSNKNELLGIIDVILDRCKSSPRNLLHRLRDVCTESSLGSLPYHRHVLHVIILFYILLASGLIGTRSTNLIDLEYFFYLPFCKVFTSGDKFHRTMFKALRFSNCLYLDRDILAGDLKKIEHYFSKFSQSDTKLYRETYGSYPPPIANSQICLAWEKSMGPRKIMKQKIHGPDMKAIREDYMAHFNK